MAEGFLFFFSVAPDTDEEDPISPFFLIQSDHDVPSMPNRYP